MKLIGNIVLSNAKTQWEWKWPVKFFCYRNFKSSKLISKIHLKSKPFIKLVDKFQNTVTKRPKSHYTITVTLKRMTIWGWDYGVIAKALSGFLKPT